MLVGLQQGRVTRQIVGPVPGHATPPLFPKRPAQALHDALPTFQRIVRDLGWPQRQEAGQIARPLVVLSRGKARRREGDGAANA